MRIDKYTQKMQEALQAAQDLASQANHPEITNEHFLSALLDQSEAIARPLLEKIGANVDQLRERLRSDLERRPQIHGGAADLRISNELRSVLDSAEKEMSKLKDEFTSAEHYLLALSGSNVPAAKILKDLGVTRDKLMGALQEVRGQPGFRSWEQIGIVGREKLAVVIVARVSRVIAKASIHQFVFGPALV